MTSAGFDEPRVFARSHRLRRRVLLIWYMRDTQLRGYLRHRFIFVEISYTCSVSCCRAKEPSIFAVESNLLRDITMVANLNSLSETVDLSRIDRKLADLIESDLERI